MTARVERTRASTNSLDRSIEMISSMYTQVRPVHADNPDPFSFDMSGSSVDEFRVDRLAHSAGYQMVAEPTGFVGVVTLSKGHARYAGGGQAVRISAHQSVAFPGDIPLHVEHSGYELRFVTIPVERIADRARELSGRPDLQFRMALAASQSRAAELQWRATLDYLDDELRRPDTAMNGRVFRRAALDLLMDAALAAFPNNAMPAQTSSDTSRVDPMVVAKAVHFIEANAHLPISSADIAAAANVAIRDLADGFIWRFNRSPDIYLSQLRLQRLDADLRSGDVQPAEADAVARRWGLRDLSEFDTLYRQVFGVAPRHVRNHPDR